LQKAAAPAVLGKPEQAGGVRDRDATIGRALGALALRCGRDSGLPLSGLRVAVRSVDESALHTAQVIFEAGCVIVAISGPRGGLRCSTGIDINELIDHARST